MTSSVAFAAALALLLAAWAAAAVSWRRSSVVRPWQAAVASVAPLLLLVLTVLAAHDRFRDLDLRAEGLRSSSALRVGGSVADDHLVVRGLPPAALEAVPGSDGVRVRLAAGAPGGAAVVRSDRARPFVNAVRLEAGTTVRVNGGEPLVYDARRRVFHPEGRPDEAGPVLPMRGLQLGPLHLPLGRQPPPDVAVYPLAAWGGPPAAGTASFVAWGDRGLGRPLHLRRTPFLVLTGPEVEVTRPDGAVVAFAAEAAEIPAGRAHHLALLRVDLPAGEEPRPGRVQELRSFRVEAGAGEVRLLLDTPGRARIPAGDLGGADDPAVLAVSGAEQETSLLTLPPDQLLVRFGFLGGPLATELFSRLWVVGDALEVTTHTGTRRYPVGALLPVGGETALLLRALRPGPPWGALCLAGLLTLVAAAASWRWRLRILPLLLLTGTEALLAVRLLVAWQVTAIDPAAADAVPLSLAGLAAVPLALHAAAAALDVRPGRALLVHGGVATAAVALVLARSPLGAAVILAGSAAVPLAAASLYLAVRWLRRAPLERATASVLPALALGGALVAFRLATLLVLGWKERASIGGTVVALSLLAVPWALAAFALLWGAARRRAAAPLTLAAAFAGLLVVLFGVVPMVVRDWGTALVNSIPVALLFALPAADADARGRLGRRWALVLAAPLAAMVLLHVAAQAIPALGLAGGLGGSDPAAVEAARTDPAAAERLVERRTAAGGDALRLLNLVAPERLARAGTTDAEGLLLVMASVRSYTARGPLGEGLLGVPPAPALGPAHRDDNVMAVHLLGAFGWVGVVLLLLVPAAWALAPLALHRGAVLDLDARAAFGLLLLWTVLATALYMAAANAELLVFTGKNATFLAPASLSDLAEGTLLVGLALGALGRTGDA